MGGLIAHLLCFVDSGIIFVDGRRKLLDLVKSKNQLHFYIWFEGFLIFCTWDPDW